MSPLLTEVEVVVVERPSPSFVRVVLGGRELAELGVDGPLVDQRIKIVFPPERGPLPHLADAGESWYETWSAMPADERGQMRTYTVREVCGSGAGTRLVVDFVVHGDPPEGAGAGWASRAAVGDRVVVVAPRRGTPFGGREFAPGSATDLLLAGDESALPAIAGILRDLPHASRGVVFVEVPVIEDIALLPAPDDVDVRWLPRSGQAVGARLVPAVRRHLGLAETTETSESSGPAPGEQRGRYAWLAGESTVVRTLRRTLVGELGWDRHQVCFMGYWRIGVAMRS